MDDKIKALAQFLEIDPEDITEDKWGDYEAENGDYKVLTDSEADAAWDEALESYIDDIILPEMPETFRYYFDNEAWKRDARIDGRGHSLNYYDGSEEYEEVNGEDYYIYRTN